MAGLNACFVISHDAGIIVSKKLVWKRLASERIESVGRQLWGKIQLVEEGQTGNFLGIEAI